MTQPHSASPIANAARRWVDRCILADGSVFSDESLWTVPHLEELKRFYIENPDAGEGSFFEKLEVQLQPAQAGAKKLAAEMLWVMVLPVKPGAIGANTKRLQLRQVWEWSGEPLPHDHWCLQDDVLGAGTVHPGTAYQTHRWREFRFFIDCMLAWKRLPEADRQALLGDPWAFAEWMDQTRYVKGRQLRHILLFLIYPDHFERVATDQHKSRITKAFAEEVGEDTVDDRYGSAVQTDRAIHRVRERFESRQDPGDEPFDFYREPYIEKWYPTTLRETPDPDETARPGRAQEASQWIRDRFGHVKVWVMNAGQGGRLWRSFKEEGAVAIALDTYGDLSAYASREELHAAIAEEEKARNPMNSSLAAWQFAHDMKEGDVVVVKTGARTVLGWGRVTGPYRHDAERGEYGNLRSVRWEAFGPWELPEGQGGPTKALTEMAEFYPEWVRRAFETLEATDGVEDPDSPEPYDPRDALKEVFLEAGELTRILDALGRKKNVILQGPPGVGKTFVARRLADALVGRKDAASVAFVQFHQSYAYEDFIQGYRPVEGGGFALQDGIFHRFCRQAAEDPETPQVFIIDEINRANLSRVFGELLVLLEADKRGPKHGIPLTYSPADPFFVPKNVYVLGLMNTADRSLALVDYALRRRFTFFDLRPAFGSDRFQAHLLESGAEEDLVQRIVARMRELNEVIRTDVRNLGPGFEVGHSYFVPSADDSALTEEGYRRIIDEEVRPLLREYWFDDPEKWKAQVDRLLR